MPSVNNNKSKIKRIENTNSTRNEEIMDVPTTCKKKNRTKV